MRNLGNLTPLPTPPPTPSLRIKPETHVESTKDGTFTAIFSKSGKPPKRQATCYAATSTKILARPFVTQEKRLLQFWGGVLYCELDSASLVTLKEKDGDIGKFVTLGTAVRITLRPGKHASIAVFEGTVRFEPTPRFEAPPVAIDQGFQVVANLETRESSRPTPATFSPEEELEFERLRQILETGSSDIQPLAPFLIPTPTSLPAPDAEGLLEKINAAMESLESYHMEGELVVKASQEAETELISLSFEGEATSAGDIQLRFTIFAGALSFDTRQVAGLIYIQNPLTSEWTVEEEVSEDGVLQKLHKALRELPKLENVTVDVVSLVGVPFYRIASFHPTDPEAERVWLWVEADDLLIRMVQIQGRVRASEYKGLVPPGIEELFVDLVAQIGQFNEPVEIVAPQ